MPAAVRTPRASWVREGLRFLAAGGPDAVRVEALAVALGVSKGGFYWHFRDRAALLEAVLDTWEEGSSTRRSRPRTEVVATAAPGCAGCSPWQAGAKASWSSSSRCVTGRAATRGRGRVTRVDNRRMAYLRPLFAEFCDSKADVEGRCLLVLTLFVGQSYVTATHGRRARPSVTAAALEHVLH